MATQIPSALAPKLVYCVNRGSSRLHHAAAGLFHEVPHDSLQVAGALIDSKLPLSAGAFVQNGVNVLDGTATAEVVNDIIDKFQQLDGEVAHGNFHFLAEVD